MLWKHFVLETRFELAFLRLKIWVPQPISRLQHIFQITFLKNTGFVKGCSLITACKTFPLTFSGGSGRIRTYIVYPEGTVLQPVVTPPSSAALPNYFKVFGFQLNFGAHDWIRTSECRFCGPKR